ncbi:MAG: sodium:solute symporter family protein [Aeropyrum sp.]|nr:sodium:solute symporter family protein [Aeropyrum sp.]MCE4616256.1 sodium:solute symporter family protein [Aeropyrum sp.]
MEHRVIVSVGALLAYFIIGTILTLIARRRLSKGEEGFYLAGRDLGGFISAMTYAATTYSSFMIVGLVGLAYFTGIGSFVFEIAYLIATVVLLSIFAGKVWKMSRSRGWISPGEMLADLLGSPYVALAASVVFLVALIPYASAQLKGIAETIVALAGADPSSIMAYRVAVVIALAILIAWSLIAGIRGVALTDAFQGLWMLTAATALLVWVALLVGDAGAGRVLEAMEGAGLFNMWDLALLIGFITPWAFFAVTNPQVVQRLYVPRDQESLRRMIILFALFGLYYTVVVVAIGMVARAGVELGLIGINPEDRDQVTPQLLAAASPLLAAIVFTSIVAASVSTADSIILTLASSASRDIGGYFLGLSERGRLRLGYAAAVLFTVLMGGFAMMRVGYIVQLSVISSVMLLGLAPVTLAAWLGFKPRASASITSIILGPLATVLTALKTGSLAVSPATPIVGVPLSVWVLVLSTAIVAAGIYLNR